MGGWQACRQAAKQIDRLAGWQTGGLERLAGWQTTILTNRETDRLAGRQTTILTNIETDRLAGRQTRSDKQTG